MKKRRPTLIFSFLIFCLSGCTFVDRTHSNNPLNFDVFVSCFEVGKNVYRKRYGIVKMPNVAGFIDYDGLVYDALKASDPIRLDSKPAEGVDPEFLYRAPGQGYQNYALGLFPSHDLIEIHYLPDPYSQFQRAYYQLSKEQGDALSEAGKKVVAGGHQDLAKE
jgi:hypothetical protein